MRNKTSSSLQKTFDEYDLIRSTANYFDTQGNEVEALRSWRRVLDQIYHHNAYRTPTACTPKSEPEKIPLTKVQELENECKKRINILEGLKKSRQENYMSGMDKQSPNMTFNGLESSTKTEDWKDSFHLNEIDLTFKQLDIIDHNSSPSNTIKPKSSLSKNESEISCSSSKAPLAISLSNHSPPPQIITESNALTSLMPIKTRPQILNTEKRRKMRHTLRPCNFQIDKSPSRSGKFGENQFTCRAASLAWNSMRISNKDICSSEKKCGDVNLKSYLNLCHEFSQSEISLLKVEKKQSSGIYRNAEIHPKSDRLISPDISLENLDRLNDRVHINVLPSSSRCKWKSRSPMHNSKQGLDQLVNPHESNSSSYSRSSQLILQKEYSKDPSISSYDCYSKYYDANTTKIRTRSQPFSVAKPAHSIIPVTESSNSKKERNNRIKGNALSSQKSRKFQEISDATAVNSQKRPGQAAEQSFPSLNGDMVISEGIKSTRRGSKSKKTCLGSAHKDTKFQCQTFHESRKLIGDTRISQLLEKLPAGVDEGAVKQILNEIVVEGDEVHWNDIAGLDVAKTALKETVVYPFLRPDLFMGLREPAGGMLLFGPPGTGKTMLARAVATESKSTFFSISAGSLISKYLGESEKLVRALFKLAKVLAPSIIFVDEIDSLLSSRSGSGENDSTKRIKTEFLIQWSDLQKAASCNSASDKNRDRENGGRVLVLAATNLPWAIDEAARRRFVRRQYIPLPERITRAIQLKNLLSRQKHELGDNDFQKLVDLTEGFSCSDITALAKDAAMGPLRSLGEAMLRTSMDDIRQIKLSDFETSLTSIRPSVSEESLKTFENWAKVFGERGG
ncbi:putative aaa family atpase [Golovinomyces cichoracearum]|uniref:Putative aaa family atpase n=1 Tax=Golovinomyces cichoracearum TaxID=62708 RepID=A0A420IKT9_9PEZI|nr:putative aaa family atpase [Golovinomyces cichoracearum]